MNLFGLVFTLLNHIYVLLITVIQPCLSHLKMDSKPVVS
jgi:hypothetical protein